MVKTALATKSKTNFKMYKAKTKWVFAAGATTLTLTMAGGAMTANAATIGNNNTNSNNDSAATSTATTTTQNQVTANSSAANTIATYPHKSIIDNAVSSASSQEGLTITKKADSTVSAANHSEADSKIQSDYTSQAATIKATADMVKEGRQQKTNYDTYNETHGDTSALDAKASEAQSVKGLTITKGSDKTSSFAASDTAGLHKWASDTASDYQSQTKAIQDGITSQEKNNQTYAAQMDDYDKQLKALNSLPSIASNGSIKLQGQAGQKGSTKYYQSMTVTGIPEGATILSDIGWHSDSQLQGGNGPAKIYPGQMALSKLDNLSQFINVTDVIRHKGTITLTNAAKDQNGNYYDLHMTMGTDLADNDFETGSSIDPTNAVVGPAGADGSIEFVGYGKLSKGNIKITDLWFTRHGSNTKASVYVISTFADLDNKQFLTTNLGNALSYVPANNQVKQTNNTFISTVDQPRGLDGFNSTPDGTFLMVGQGTDFNVTFGWYNDAPIYNFMHKSPSEGGVNWSTWPTIASPETGFQFNLFGPAATSKVLIHPVLKTTNVSYHYDTAKVSQPTVPATASVTYHYDVLNYTPKAEKHWTDKGQVTDNKVYADGSQATATITTKLPYASDFDNGLKSVVITENYSNFAKYVNGSKATVSITDDTGKDLSGLFTVADDGNGTMTLTMKDPKQANGQTVKVSPTWTINADVPDGTAFKNEANLTVNDTPGTPTTATVKTYTSEPHKDVELGDNVQGDTANSIAGQTVADGTVVTWPLSSNDLPANREQDVTSYQEVDPLDSNLEYKGFKAYLPDANGKLTDVTSHIAMEQNGQTLTFTWDSYLIGLANKDKTTAFKKPVIDLVTKVNGTSKLVNNQFNEHIKFKDQSGHDSELDTTSNKVSLKTPDTPNPQKEDLDENGKNINAQEVKAGQHITYQLDWDFSKDKGVVTTPDMIKKGFFFADPIDSNALEVGDMSKAQVIDANGNKVDGITLKKYDAFSDLPQTIQDQIKENGLENRFAKGPIVIASADDPQSFYDKYVKTGSTLKVQIPTIVKDNYNGSFSNTAYQFGFGKATPTNTVSNFVKPTPKTPATPNQPSQPSTPAAPQPASPAQPAAPAATPSTPAAQPAPQQQQNTLPQTGNANDAALIGLAAAALAGSMSLAAMGLRKKEA